MSLTPTRDQAQKDAKDARAILAEAADEIAALNGNGDG
jgi:hypothetical protein